METDILELALKNAVGDIRVTYGSRWLVWDSSLTKWLVYEHKAYQRGSSVIVDTANLQNAVDVLLEG